MGKTIAKRRGRPPLPAGEKKHRDRPLYVLLDPPERAAIDAAAESSGQPSSTWARQVLLRAAQRTAK